MERSSALECSFKKSRNSRRVIKLRSKEGTRLICFWMYDKWQFPEVSQRTYSRIGINAGNDQLIAGISTTCKFGIFQTLSRSWVRPNYGCSFMKWYMQQSSGPDGCTNLEDAVKSYKSKGKYSQSLFPRSYVVSKTITIGGFRDPSATNPDRTVCDRIGRRKLLKVEEGAKIIGTGNYLKSRLHQFL